MKFALIGQEIPALLPSLLTDLFFAGQAAAELAMEEKNPAMAEVLNRYAAVILERAPEGSCFTVSPDREKVLRGADCVIYAGDLLAASRFRQDQEALSGAEEGDEGLSDQARVNGGIGGLMHTLRQGEMILPLCRAMRDCCPKAIVITLGQPVARTVEMFSLQGFRCYGLGHSALRGPGGLEGVCRALKVEMKTVSAGIAGLPGFAFLLSLKSADGKLDLLPKVHRLAEEGVFGRLAKRWLRDFGAFAIGSAPEHAEFMAAQEDFAPDPRPAFGESVERRKERILWMNTVGQNGQGDPEGQMAQMLLLSRAPVQRPVQLALALVRREDLLMHGVARRNDSALAGLPTVSVIEAPLQLEKGREVPLRWPLPDGLRGLCLDIDEASRLAARAAFGDRTSLRECIELDPALDGLDRLYLQDVVDRMIGMHSDILTIYDDGKDGEDD